MISGMHGCQLGGSSHGRRTACTLHAACLIEPGGPCDSIQAKQGPAMSPFGKLQIKLSGRPAGHATCPAGVGEG